MAAYEEDDDGWNMWILDGFGTSVQGKPVFPHDEPRHTLEFYLPLL